MANENSPVRVVLGFLITFSNARLINGPQGSGTVHGFAVRVGSEPEPAHKYTKL